MVLNTIRIILRYLFIPALLVLLCATCIQAQNDDDPRHIGKLYVKGFVMGADTNQTIPLANIQNKNSGERYVSNRYGAFGIWLNETDTLSFSVLGYRSVEVAASVFVQRGLDNPYRVRLKPQVFKLRDVQVNAHKLHQDSMARKAAQILKTSPLLNDYSTVNSKIGAMTGGSLDAILSAGSSQLDQMYKLQRLLALYREQQLVDEKLTDDIIIRSTGIQPKLIPEFKKFCNLPNYFVLQSNDYYLILAIRNCWDDYSGRKTDTRYQEIRRKRLND